MSIAEECGENLIHIFHMLEYLFRKDNKKNFNENFSILDFNPISNLQY